MFLALSLQFTKTNITLSKMRNIKFLLLLSVVGLSSCTASTNFALESIVMGLIGIGVVSWIVFFIVFGIIRKETPAIVITAIIMLLLLGLILG
jgi:uncharacterized membrane protein YGL010W